MPRLFRAMAGAASICALLVASTTSGVAQTVSTPTPIATALPTDTPTPAASVTATPAATLTATPAPSVTATPTPTVFNSGVPCATDDPALANGVQRSERRGSDDQGDGNADEFGSGNGHNEVVLHNCTDSRLRVMASIQLNTIPGRVVAPVNMAYAEGSCLECQTLAVALQIDLYNGARANEVRPENYAFAINTNCTRCMTVARAIQYAQPVDDPHDVPGDVAETVDALDRELRSIQRDPNLGLAEAETRLNAVIQRFNALGGSLGEQRDERDD
ncbi:MAG TPA: hypothetical protein VGQ62_17055 [Chloroflexota bacterium]|nr:hypothetical protein [Chloroflexota bacterium]